MKIERYPEAVRLVDEGKARPQVVEAVELIRDGLKWHEIIERLGISKSTLYQRLNDPTDEQNRARKLRNTDPCANCGGPTSWSGGNSAPKGKRLCENCYLGQYEERRERMIAAWNKGANLREIAKQEGLSITDVNSCLCHWREKGHEVELHTLPHKDHEERWRTIQKMWLADADIEEIREKVGAASIDSVNYMIYRMRERGWDMPRRARGSNGGWKWAESQKQAA